MLSVPIPLPYMLYDNMKQLDLLDPENVVLIKRAFSPNLAGMEASMNK
jgi:hypothetical protein